MSYYPVDYFASGLMHLSATEDCSGRYEEYWETPIDVCDLVHGRLQPSESFDLFLLATQARWPSG
jgi:hypothetical protein